LYDEQQKLNPTVTGYQIDVKFDKFNV